MRKADVLKVYKTQAAIARELGISLAAVSQWGVLVPPDRAKELSERRPGELHFDPGLYRHSSERNRRIAAALTA